MDTPDKNPIGTPVSKIQESPFSNFINSLSPINPPKSIHISQTISSLSFTSPPSVFTSPHVSLQKDCKFLRRFQVSDLAKSPLASDQGSKDSVARNITNADQHSDTLAQGEGTSAGESSDTPLEDSSECAAELQRVLIYDNGSPHRKSKTENSSDKDTQCEADTSLALVPFVKNPSQISSFGTSLNLRNINHDNEDAGCDWLSLITCNTDLFIFDSPDVNATSKDPSHKSQEETHDEEYDMQNLLQIDSDEYTKANESTENSTQPTEEIELLQIDQPSGNPDISSVNEFLSHDTGEKPGKEVIVNLHRGMLRRCLTFEIPRTKKSIEELSGSRQPVTPTGDSRRCILPSIGLHLNALAATSKDCSVLNQNILSPTTQDPIVNSSFSLLSRKDEGEAEHVLESAEDPSQASLYASNEGLKNDSPKKKRKKAETIEEGESCKRCNCKKSKCLKLYCECFAAGIYCIEPCSCQDCFNKPIHEDIVLATRKQIESRNPLAFAPKVIRTESTQELREDSNQTPASARHKRGCNCKKSNCLKKYCECYQGGVGCSINCRCEGCKNAFGIKDGSILVATQPEMHRLQASEKSVMDRISITSDFHDDDEQNSEFSIPKTPSRLSRSSIPLATSSKGKPPRSSKGQINPSSSLLPTDGIGRTTFLRTQSGIEKRNQNVLFDDIPEVLQNMSPPSSGLKTLSPNSKRISSPHHDNGQAIGLSSSRKLILRSIPSFPSLSPRH